MRLRDILSELEGRVEPLRIQAEKAEQFIALDKEKKEPGDRHLAGDPGALRQGAAGARGENLPGPGPARGAGGGASAPSGQRAEDNYRQTNQCTVAAGAGPRPRPPSLDEQAVRAEGEASLLENDAAHTRETLRRLGGPAGGGLPLRPGRRQWKSTGKRQERTAQKERQIQESREQAARLYPAPGGAAPGRRPGHPAGWSRPPRSWPSTTPPLAEQRIRPVLHPVRHGGNPPAGRGGGGQRPARPGSA